MHPQAHRLVRCLTAATTGLALVSGVALVGASEARADDIAGDACYASEVRFEGLTAGAEVNVAVADSGLRVQPYLVTPTPAGGSATLTAGSDGVAVAEVASADGGVFACQRAAVTWQVRTGSSTLGEWVQESTTYFPPVYPLESGGGSARTIRLAFHKLGDPLAKRTLTRQSRGRVQVTLKPRNTTSATVSVVKIASSSCRGIDAAAAIENGAGTTLAQRAVQLQAGWTMIWAPKVKAKGCMVVRVDTVLGETNRLVSNYSSVIRVR